MRDANIVTLNKNEKGRRGCNNYRGIAPLRIAGKLLDRVFLERLQELEERDYPESQCGFRAKQSTIDKIFSIRKLHENCREQRQSLCISFIDLTFDLVKPGLFKILLKIGCPPNLLNIIRSFHDDMKDSVVFDGSSSDTFNIPSGVKQGCVLAHTLFGTLFTIMLNTSFDLQLKELTFERDLMEDSSTLPDWKPRPRSVSSAFATLFLSMMRQLPHTLGMRYNNWSIALALPSRTLH